MKIFKLAYDVELNHDFKLWIVENIQPSMVSEGMDSSQYNLNDLLHKIQSIVMEDTKEKETLSRGALTQFSVLEELQEQGVDYIEIVYG